MFCLRRSKQNIRALYLEAQGAFFQHIHASEPEHWPGYNLVIRAIVKIFKRELLVEY